MRLFLFHQLFITLLSQVMFGIRLYSTNNTDADADLAGVLKGGVIREDVMEKIWQIDSFPLPLTDMLSKITSKSNKKEWTQDELGSPATNNKQVDGADISQDDSSLGTRVANFHQIAVKEIQISKRANAVDSIGRMGTLAYQVSNGQKRLKRDVEAQMSTQQASVAGDGNTTASVSAGLGAQIETNTKFGATGSAGGFNTGTGVFDAPTNGTARAVTETLMRDVAQDVYEEGGNTTHVMGTPTVIRLISAYLFSSSATVAQMNNMDTKGESPMTAYGAANVFVTDFGQVLKLLPNRLQQVDSANESSLYFLDSAHLHQSFITGYQVEPLSKTGLSEKRLISVDYCLCVGNEKAQGMIADIDETAAMTA